MKNTGGISTSYGLLVIAILFLSSSTMIISSASFIRSTNVFSSAIRRKSPPLSMVKLNDKVKSDAFLRFSSSYSYTSSPIHLQRSNATSASSTLRNFFQNDAHRNCLLIGSGNMEVRDASLKSVHKPLIDSLWEKEATHYKSHGIERSSEGIEVLELFIKTPFLVFLIKASTLIGAKLANDGEKEELFVDGKIHSPEYQFLLFAEDFEANGPPPLVWIFNLLTGNQRKRDLLSPRELKRKHLIHCYLRVWASESKSIKGDIKADRIVFKAVCKADIDIKFPAFLLQILPVRKEIIEEQGNKALLQSMERDVVPGVNEFREAYIKWQRKH